MNTWNIGSGRLVLEQGDLTRFDGDAVVNAANSRLAGGGGVDGAIHAAAGPQLLEACKAIVRDRGYLPPGRAVATPGFNLPARLVIHTVGPVWKDGRHGEKELLASAYSESLRLARENGAARVAFPAISCGAYAYPVEAAAYVALGALASGLRQGAVREARMVLYSAESLAVWTEAAQALFGQGTGA